MPDYDDLQDQIAGLRRDQSLTRWYVGRTDRDIAELGAGQTEHGGKLDALHTRTEQLGDQVQDVQDDITELKGSVHSLSLQVKSLTRSIGALLTHFNIELPDNPEGEDQQ